LAGAQVADALAARRGYAPDYEMTREAPPGFATKRVSTLKRTDEGVQWHIVEPDKMAQLEAIKSYAAGLADPLRGSEDPILPPVRASNDLLTGYVVGDAHFGMLSWAPETGASYDLKIAERLTCGAIDRLVMKTDPSANALLVDLGDFLHVDNYSNTTPDGGNSLDADGRYAKIVRVAARCMRHCIRQLLAKHLRVKVISVPGNHNRVGSVWMNTMLDAVYEREQRVTIDTSPSQYMVHEFGSNMIAATHKPNKTDDVAALVATRWPEIWGRTRHRVLLTGHEHHRVKRQSVVAKGRPGLVVETFETLAPVDAWHDEQGYRANRSMTAITWHRDHGEESRDTVNVSRLEE
jgi:hypothetical protein